MLGIFFIIPTACAIQLEQCDSCTLKLLHFRNAGIPRSSPVCDRQEGRRGRESQEGRRGTGGIKARRQESQSQEP